MIRGEKTEGERFAGARMTLTIEAMMRDARALQTGTSHYMGENFSRAFNITFNDVNNEQAYAHTTSWGFSTRFIGALIMTHGDDRGLVLPPKLAPFQAVIVPIFRNNDPEAKERVLSEAHRLADAARALGVRVRIDERDGMSPGWKFNEWEQKGVPLRVELGPKDIESGTALLANRLEQGKQTVRLEAVAEELAAALPRFHDALYARAEAFRREHTFEAESYEELKELVEHGFVYATHCGDPESERAIQEETRATVRCIPVDGPSAEGTACVHTGRPSGYPRKVVFARAY